MGRCCVRDLKDKMRVEEVFLVSSHSIGTTKAGAPYLRLQLTDNTGSIGAVKWQITDQETAALTGAGYARICGQVQTYNDTLQIKVDTCSACGCPTDPTEFLPVSSRDPDEMLDELDSLLQTITSPHLARLLRVFFDDPDFAARFRDCPAAKSVHQAWIHGLLEHTLKVTQHCDALTKLYPQADRDLLLTAAALHDIGKVRELSWSGAFDYTADGNLIGHVVEGTMMVREAAAGIEDFDPLLNTTLQHAILAHHGKLEFGSPKQPHSLEALMLHYADDLDAKVEMYGQAVLGLTAAGSTSLFTPRHSLLGHPVFRGIPCEDDTVPEDASSEDDEDYDPFA